MSPDRPRYTIVVGLDFGTAYTKCIVRNLYDPSECHPVSFVINGKVEHFVPSIVLRSGNRVRTPFETVMDSNEFSHFLKMRLLSHASDAAGLWGGAVGIQQARADAAFFLSHVLYHVHKHNLKKWPDFGEHPDDIVLINICIPVADTQRPDAVAEFDRVIRAAYVSVGFLADTGESMPPPAYADIEAILCDEAALQRVADKCTGYPETSANVFSFINSTAAKDGIYVVADVGGGTVDISIFKFETKGIPPLKYYYSEVIFEGSSQMEIRLQQRIPHAQIRHLSLVKEGRPCSATLDRALVDEALVGIKRQIYERVGKASGNTIKAALSKISPSQDLALNALKTSLRFILVGNGFVADPYEKGLRFFHRTYGWEKEPEQVLLDAPADFARAVGAKDSSALFRRFTVAYGLSFDPVNLVPAMFPNEVPYCQPMPTDFRVTKAGEDTADT